MKRNPFHQASVGGRSNMFSAASQSASQGGMFTAATVAQAPVAPDGGLGAVLLQGLSRHLPGLRRDERDRCAAGHRDA